MNTRSKRYHHVKFDDDDEFETPAFEYLNKIDDDVSKTMNEDEDEISLHSDTDGGSSDEDAAPEDLSFLTSKQTALKKMKEAIQSIQAEKIKVKEKRRKIDEQYKEQKKRKLEEMKKARLPDDFFDDLPEKTATNKTMINPAHREEINSLGDEDEGSFADTEDDLEHYSDKDFIPFDSNKTSGIEARSFKEYQKASLSKSLTAAEFKYRQLYGNRIARESSKDKMGKRQKKLAGR